MTLYDTLISEIVDGLPTKNIAKKPSISGNTKPSKETYSKRRPSLVSKKALCYQPLSLESIPPLLCDAQKILPVGSQFQIPFSQSFISCQFLYKSSPLNLPYVLTFDLDGNPLTLRLDADLMDILLQDLATNMPYDELPNGILVALLHAALAPLFKHLLSTSDISLSLVDINHEGLSRNKNIQQEDIKKDYNSRAGSQIHFRCKTLIGAVGWGAILVDTATLERLRSLSYTINKHLSFTPNNINTLPLNITVTLGTSHLSAGDLADLALGDVLLLSSATPFPQPETAMAVNLNVENHHFAEALWHPNYLEITSITQQHKEAMMSDENGDDFSLDTDDQTVYDISVPVDFEVSHKQLPLSEIKHLKAGEVIELDRPTESPIVLKVNGQKIAEANLVQINQRVGALITRTFISSEKK